MANQTDRFFCSLRLIRITLVMNRESFVDWANCHKELCAMVDFGHHTHYTFKLGGDSHQLLKTTCCRWSIQGALFLTRRSTSLVHRNVQTELFWLVKSRSGPNLVEMQRLFEASRMRKWSCCQIYPNYTMSFRQEDAHIIYAYTVYLSPVFNTRHGSMLFNTLEPNTITLQD